MGHRLLLMVGVSLLLFVSDLFAGKPAPAPHPQVHAAPAPHPQFHPAPHPQQHAVPRLNVNRGNTVKNNSQPNVKQGPAHAVAKANGHLAHPYQNLNRKGPQPTSPMLRSMVMKEASKVQNHLYQSHHWHHWYHLHHAWLWGVYAYAPASTTTSVVNVPNGNSVVVSGPTGTTRVRLAGVGAPMGGQAFFSESRDSLDSIANGQQVRVFPVGTDFDGTMVGQVYLNSGDYVNAMQVRSGLAWDAVDDGFDMTVAAAEEEAQIAGAGFWSGDYAPAF